MSGDRGIQGGAAETAAGGLDRREALVRLLDLVVEDKVIVEVQAIERLTRSMMPNCFPISVFGARA